MTGVFRVKGRDNRKLMAMRVTDSFVTDPSRLKGGWRWMWGWGEVNKKEEGSGEALRVNFSSLGGVRVMERDVSGTRQRAFFQSICPASRPTVNGTGPIKRLDTAKQRLG